jgi:hypothetical protein
VPKPLQAAGNPFTFDRFLDKNPSFRSLAKRLGEALALSTDPLLEDLPFPSDDAHLAVPLLDVDAYVERVRQFGYRFPQLSPQISCPV